MRTMSSTSSSGAISASRLQHQQQPACLTATTWTEKDSAGFTNSKENNDGML